MTDRSHLERRARERLARLVENIDPATELVRRPRPQARRSGVVAAVVAVAALVLLGIALAHRPGGGADTIAVATRTERASRPPHDDTATLEYQVRIDRGTLTISGTTSSAVATVEVSFAVVRQDGRTPTGDASGAAPAVTSSGRGGFVVDLPAAAVSPHTEVRLVGRDEAGAEIERRDLVVRVLSPGNEIPGPTGCVTSAEADAAAEPRVEDRRVLGPC